MSVGLVTAAALLGAVVGALVARAAPALARRFAADAREPADPGGPAPGHADADARVGSGRPARAAPIRRVSGAAGPASSVPLDVNAPVVTGPASVVAALVFGGLAVALGPDPALPAFLLVATGGLVLAAVDLSCLRLPDPLVAATAVAGGAGLVVAALVAGTPGRLGVALAGAALALAGYVTLALLPGSRLGFGDVKLAAALGLPLGWLGWPALWLGLLLPHLLQGVVVLVLLATRRVRRDTPLPFGPAILAGAWLAVLLA
ncbi:prepilin peptidase [Micromonospora halophytica]|uniref:Leader peptidase (Prepilin peptidase) / N-methyltransferase n=1 Tax=Micromonospora halophytica TaxID=47864 RepID=A0A1C5HQ97_9ACTN|nr:A24 family peptidase [Micromonospora halophytica]SCG48216.1 leader peptidase (prepilin peptidase) / N-methyltransferase [Micromonospora halophytica]